MSNNPNYPVGANIPEAPWNKVDQEPVNIDVVISQSLSRSTTIRVTDYIANKYKDEEYDEEGYINRTGGIDYDFSNSDLKEAYEMQEYTIPELLEYLKSYLIIDIAECSEESSRKKMLQSILKCCEGWKVDETEVIEE